MGGKWKNVREQDLVEQVFVVICLLSRCERREEKKNHFFLFIFYHSSIHSFSLSLSSLHHNCPHPFHHHPLLVPLSFFIHSGCFSLLDRSFNGFYFGLGVHWSTDLSVHSDSCAEVELVTLIQEQTPLYKLRADPLTSFSGNIFFNRSLSSQHNYFPPAATNYFTFSFSAFSLSRMTFHFVCEVIPRLFHFLITATLIINSFIITTCHLFSSPSGYENHDWFISTPVLDPNEIVDLSPEFISETLSYFILSAERLSQMTKTYNDIGVVTRLLEEVSLPLFITTMIQLTIKFNYAERAWFGTGRKDWSDAFGSKQKFKDKEWWTQKWISIMQRNCKSSKNIFIHSFIIFSLLFHVFNLIFIWFSFFFSIFATSSSSSFLIIFAHHIFT